MKKPFWLLTILILLLGCEKKEIYPEEYTDYYYTPILITRDQMEKSFSFLSSKEIYSLGKIYVNNNYIFLNEPFKGIHIIDNTNPSAPVKIGFIQIPGNVDIAIKGNTLFADNAIDLIAVDISNIQNPIITCRITAIFPELLPPGYEYMPKQFDINHRPENTIIVEWTKHERTEN